MIEVPLDDEQLTEIVALAGRLPTDDVIALARATSGGSAELALLRARAGADSLRDACKRLAAMVRSGADEAAACGALLGAERATRLVRAAASIDVVWTGPASRVTTGRLTPAAIIDTIDAARREILLVGYAVHTEPSVEGALEAAAERGVEITLLLERHTDNPGYSGGGDAFTTLPAMRLAWRSDQRPTAGAAMHAKVLVVDRRLTLVGSANLTGWGMERNLECGILLQGGPHPKAIHAHLQSLIDIGVLTRIQ